MAGSQAGAGTCRARTDGDVVQGIQQRRAVDVRKREVCDVGQAMRTIAVNDDWPSIFCKGGFEAISESSKPAALAVHFLHRDLAGHSQSDNSRNVQGSRAESALVAAAVEE